MSIDGRIDAADRKNSRALSKFENKWGAGAETAKERKQMAADQSKLSKSTKATTAGAIAAGRKQNSDQTKAMARKAALDAARKRAPKPLPTGGWEELSNLTDKEKRQIYKDMGVEGY